MINYTIVISFLLFVFSFLSWLSTYYHLCFTHLSYAYSFIFSKKKSILNSNLIYTDKFYIQNEQKSSSQKNSQCPYLESQVSHYLSFIAVQSIFFQHRADSKPCLSQIHIWPGWINHFRSHKTNLFTVIRNYLGRPRWTWVLRPHWS